MKCNYVSKRGASCNGTGLVLCGDGSFMRSCPKCEGTGEDKENQQIAESVGVNEMTAKLAFGL